MAKQVASTLKTVLDNPNMEAIRDRGTDIIPVARENIANWSMDLYTRKPGPALNPDGTFKGTDLDLAAFLAALADRGAVINLPKYKGMRGATKREGERVIAKENRHGRITGLVPNQDVFSFSVRVFDYNVVTQDSETGRETVGAPRCFALTDVHGKWHEGWERIEFSPTAKENDFLNNNSLWTENTVVFKNFVHPNRWISFYGQYYFIAKALVERLTEEASVLNKQIKELQESGVQYPASGEGAQQEWSKTEKVGETTSIMVETLQAEVDIPDFQGDYPTPKKTTDELVRITQRRRELVYDIKPKLNFAIRSVELAFFKHGFQDGTEKMPAWITDAKWERDFVQKGKRTAWNRLVLFQPAPGQPAVSLRYRKWTKKETIAAGE